MTLPVWLTIPRMIAGGAALGAAVWMVLSIRADIRAGGYREGVADTLQAERLCNEGTVCADMAAQRFRDSERAAEQARQQARERERRAIAADMKMLDRARAREAERAAAAVNRLVEFERRLQRERDASPSCEAWLKTPVPCPVIGE